MPPADPVNDPEDARQFAQLLARGRVVFFVGAGISADAGIPTNFAREAAALFLPTERRLARLVRAVAGTIQQERFFEIVRRVHADAVKDRRRWDALLHVWQGADPERQARAGVACSPLRAHFGIAAYCHQHGLPLFTSNVDCLFEAAAEASDIPYRVVTARHPAPPAHGKLNIVKFHGTVRCDGKESLETLCCEMETITRPDPHLLERMTALAENHTLCFWGYSGRDLDYFQELRRLLLAGRSSPPFWVDLAFDEGWGGPVWFNARSLAARRLGPSHTPWPRDTPGQHDLRPLFDALRAESRQAIAVDHARRLLTLALCLEGIGRYDAALRAFGQYAQVRQSRSAIARVEDDLIHARLLDGCSRYRESEAMARAAGQRLAASAAGMGTSARFIADCQAVRAIYLQAMARKLRFVQLSILRAAGLRAVRFLPRALLELFRSVVWDTLRLRRRFARLEKDAAMHPGPLARVHYLMALRALNDHAIANAAVRVRLARVPGLRARSARSLSGLQDRAQRTGDAFSYVSASKYLAQLETENPQAAQLANSLHEQTTDPLNHAASLRMLAATMPHGDARATVVSDALGAARRSGSHATVLKILLAEGIAAPGQLARQAASCSGEAFELLARTQRARDARSR